MPELAHMVVLICGLTMAEAECPVGSIAAIEGPAGPSFNACQVLVEAFQQDPKVRELALRQHPAASFSIVCAVDAASEG